MYEQSHPPFSSSLDPYSPVLVEEMLAQRQDWIRVDECIVMTLKAMSKVLSAQGAAVRDLERQMPAKANKVDVQHSLAGKASVDDITKTISEVAVNIES